MTVELEGPARASLTRARPWRHLLPSRLCPLHSPKQTGQLSSQGLFLSLAAVNRHISHAKACRNAGMGPGYREMPIQVRTVDVMAGGGGAAGPAQSIRHQEPGNLAENATCTL